MSAIQLSATLNTSAANAFRFFEDAPAMLAWLRLPEHTTTQILCNFEANGHFRVQLCNADMHQLVFSGQYLEIQQGRSLAFTLRMGELVSQVSLLFSEIDEDTCEILLRHSGIGHGKGTEASIQAWSYLLERLACHVYQQQMHKPQLPLTAQTGQRLWA